MRNTNLKPIVSDEVKETRIGFMSIEDIVGRPYKKQKLVRPDFPNGLVPIEDERTLKFWLQKLSKKRVKKA